MSAELEGPVRLGFQATALSVDRLFEESASTLTGLMVDNHDVMRKEHRRIELMASSLDHLMLAWLSEILALFDSENFVASEFVAEVQHENSQFRLNGLLSGEPLDSKKHRIRGSVKSLSMHELKVVQIGDEWSLNVCAEMRT